MTRRVLAVLAGLLAALLLLTACGGEETGAPVTNIKVNDDDGYHGILLDEPYLLPAVPLKDTQGRPFDLAGQERRTLVFFGYTNCPDICQVVMSTVASGLSRLEEEQRERLQVAFVTTDPARDTPDALRTYLDRFDPSFIGVTGPMARINELGESMDIYVEKGKRLPSGGYEVDHTTVVVSVRGGQGDLVWTAATSPAEIAEDLTDILKADE